MSWEENWSQETRLNRAVRPGADAARSLGLHPTTGQCAGWTRGCPGAQSQPLWSPVWTAGWEEGLSVTSQAGAVFHLSAEARSAESCKVAPEEDVDGQQEDGVDIADASPERLLLDARQLLLQRGLLCWAQGPLWGAGEPTEPAPEQPSPGPAWG